MTGVLTDGQWAVLAPLIEACRPHHETQHHDLRRTIEVILWRCQDGACPVSSVLGGWRRRPSFASAACWPRLLQRSDHPPAGG